MTDSDKNSFFQNPLVSVIINCYNGEAFLQEAIESVYSQTYSNWEIIFWDNASNDKTESIARSFDSRLNYFQSEKLISLHAARNSAIKKCKGEVIAFLDADDIWLDNKLEKQIKAYNQGSKIIYGGYEEIDKNSNTTGKVRVECPSGFITSYLLLRNPISIGTILIDADILREYMFDTRYEIMGDYDLWVRLSIKYEIVSVDGILEMSRQHDKNISNTLKLEWLGERRYFYRSFIASNSIFKYPQIIVYFLKTELKGLVNAR